jgi:hypothetical protein
MQPQFSDIETRHRLARQFVFTNVNSPDKIIDLEAGKGWALKGKQRQQTLLCLQGSIWVTQEGDLRDYVLEEGDAFLISLPGLVLVRALKPARVGYCERLHAAPFKERFNETVFN